MKKRLLSLLLAALMLCGALSGCGAIDALSPLLDDPSSSEPATGSGSTLDTLTQERYFTDCWRADTDFADMYAEADLDYFRSLGDELLSVASGSPDSDSFDDAAFYLIDEYYYICTAHDLANLRYYRDPSDQEALAAMNQAYADRGEADGIFWDIMHQVALTDSYDLLADYCGESQAQVFSAYDPDASSDSSLRNRETELVNKYYSLSASPEPDFDACADVFVELVNVRREIAAAAGNDSYADYAYYQTYSRNYTPEDSRSVWAAVKDYFVPIRTELKAMLQDNYAKLMESGIEVSSQDALDALGTVAHGLSPEAAKAYDYLVEHGLCDNELLSTKAGVNFTSTLYWYNEPYIFLTPDGSYYDYSGIIHEFGHFLNSYAVPSDLIFGAADYEICEMQSIGMEFMATHWYEELFGPDTARMLLLDSFFNSIINVMDGAMFDEFLQRVYAEEDLTKERVCEIYAELYKEYGNDVYDGYDKEWISVPHNFDSPFYYISYCMATIPVLGLYSELQTSPEAAADTYMRLVSMDPEIYYSTEVVSELGLADPLDPAAYASAADTVVNAVKDLS